jgi:ssDNA-binding Zn-finger/Zn-ribbon topoisomerase 1
LKVKYKSDFDPVKDKSVSLPIYVEEKKFCPECKNHMVMAKSKKGATYIKCSSKSCKHQEYLDKEFVNFYIKNSDISCPKQDGGKLKCGLGKYGLYIRCSEGHFLDPTEI